MGLETFSLKTLAEMDDGRIAAAFAQELLRCEGDCADRPGDDKARVITLRIEIRPQTDERGNFDTAEVEAFVTSTVPKRRSRPYNMRATRQGLVFNELSPENARQMTLDMNGLPRPLVRDEDAGNDNAVRKDVKDAR